METNERVIADREAAHLKSLLQPEVPVGLKEMLETLRPFSGATMALMAQTKNEWLRRVPVSEMENHYFATLSWLFIQGAPENLVRSVVWDINDFRNAVMDWGNEMVGDRPRVTSEILAGADAIIQATFADIDAARYSVMEKPGEGAPETAPPN